MANDRRHLRVRLVGPYSGVSFPLVGVFYDGSDVYNPFVIGSSDTVTVPNGVTRLYLGLPDAWAFMSSPGAYDDNWGAFTVTYSISLPNQPPVSFDGKISMDEKTLLTGSVTSLDPDSDPLKYSLVGTAPTGLVLKFDGTFSFDPTGHYDYLGVGESTTVSFQFKGNDGHADLNVATETITITGVNDPPIATPDSGAIRKGHTLTISAAKGLLANDTDPDVHDHLTVASVNRASWNVGHSVRGQYGTFTLNADGRYSYVEKKGALPEKIVPQDVFVYSIDHGHGGTSSSTLTITVLRPGQSYQAGSNTTLNGGNGKSVLDGTAGHEVLLGGNGGDVLIGGPYDKLTGGKGPDIFVFGQHFGPNTITDFNVKNDAIQISKAVFTNVADLLHHTTDGASGRP